MKNILFGFFFCSTLFGFAQSNCISLSNTTFHKGEGMCYFPDSEDRTYRTAKAYVTNNCNQKVWVSLDYDGEMYDPYLSGSPTRQLLEPGERKEYYACGLPPNKGRWVIKEVEYLGGNNSGSSSSGTGSTGNTGSNNQSNAGSSGSSNSAGSQSNAGSGSTSQGSSGSGNSSAYERQRQEALQRQRQLEAQRLSQAAATGVSDAISDGFISGLEVFATIRSGEEDGELTLANQFSYHAGFEIAGAAGLHFGYAPVDEWIYDSGGGSLLFTGVNVDLYTVETAGTPWLIFGLGGEFGVGDAEWQDEDIIANEMETISEDVLLYGGKIYVKFMRYIYLDYGIGYIEGSRNESLGENNDYNEQTTNWSIGLSIPF